jgi:hypothetical protein
MRSSFAVVLAVQTVAMHEVRKSFEPAGALRQAQSLVKSKSHPDVPRRPASFRQLSTHVGAVMAAGSAVRL